MYFLYYFFQFRKYHNEVIDKNIKIHVFVKEIKKKIFLSHHLRTCSK